MCPFEIAEGDDDDGRIPLNELSISCDRLSSMGENQTFDEMNLSHCTESEFTIGQRWTDFQLNRPTRVLDQIDNICVKHVRQIDVVHGEYTIIDMQLPTEISRTVRYDLSCNRAIVGGSDRLIDVQSDRLSPTSFVRSFLPTIAPVVCCEEIITKPKL